MTTTLASGLVVSGKPYFGAVTAKTFANRTQAQREVERLGQGWAVYQGQRSRIFYAGRLDSIRDKQTPHNL